MSTDGLEINEEQILDKLAKVKPVCEVTGEDKSIFAVMGQVRRCLKKAGESDKKIKKMMDKVMKSGSYDEALNIMNEYAELI